MEGTVLSHFQQRHRSSTISSWLCCFKALPDFRQANLLQAVNWFTETFRSFYHHGRFEIMITIGRARRIQCLKPVCPDLVFHKHLHYFMRNFSHRYGKILSFCSVQRSKKSCVAPLEILKPGYFDPIVFYADSKLLESLPLKSHRQELFTLPAPLCYSDFQLNAPSLLASQSVEMDQAENSLKANPITW
jgi:hypothetical protein